MKKKRIKYKYVNSCLYSETILCDGKFMFIKLTKIQHETMPYIFDIFDTHNNLLFNGHSNSISGVKKAAKNKLIEQGALFFSERRKKEVI